MSTSDVAAIVVIFVLTPIGQSKWSLSLFNWSRNTMSTKRALIMKNENTDLFLSSIKSEAIRAFSFLSSSIGYRYLSIRSLQNCCSATDKNATGPFRNDLSSIQKGFMSSLRSTLFSNRKIRSEMIKNTTRYNKIRLT